MRAEPGSIARLDTQHSCMHSKRYVSVHIELKNLNILVDCGGTVPRSDTDSSCSSSLYDDHCLVSCKNIYRQNSSEFVCYWDGTWQGTLSCNPRMEDRPDCLLINAFNSYFQSIYASRSDRWYRWRDCRLHYPISDIAGNSTPTWKERRSCQT